MIFGSPDRGDEESHRCGAGSQAESGDSDPATDQAGIAASGQAAPAKAAADAAELTLRHIVRSIFPPLFLGS